MGAIQGDDKIQLSKSLVKSDDLHLFEQEAIQVIIDYKWYTYTRNYFIGKFILNMIYLIVLFIDVESID